MKISDLLKIKGYEIKDFVIFRFGLDGHIKEDITKLGVKEYCEKNLQVSSKKYLMFFLGATTKFSILKGAFSIENIIIVNGKKRYVLKEMTDLTDLEDRLEIEFDSNKYKGASRFITNNDFEISSISRKENFKRTVPEFDSFDKLILSFDELKEIIDNGYKDYELPLKAINAIYMIIDKLTGKQYIGSSYGADGLYGRWSEYIYTEGTGHNVDLIELVNKDKKYQKNFQFVILKTLPKNITINEAVDEETFMKHKFLSKEHGYNKN